MSLRSLLQRLTLILLCGLSAAPAAPAVHLVAFMPTGEKFTQTLDGLMSELGPKYTVKTVDVNANPDPAAIARTCVDDSAAGIILMDSKALNLYRKIQGLDSSLARLPKFIVMTLQAESSAHDIPNAAGIRFEVPGYTMITNFRSISKKDVARVAVFHRSLFSKDIETDKRFLAKEKIELVPICLDSGLTKPLTSEEAVHAMKTAFKKRLRSAKIDAYWALSDNLIVNGDALSEFWLGKVKDDNKPIIGTIETLASAKIGAAVFTADPDYTQLGVQAAGQVIEVLENGNAAGTIGFEPLISVKTVCNTTVAKDIGWKLRDDQLSRVSKIIK